MTKTKTLDAMSRAELLELCKQRGLKATAWKKERMAAELAKLEGAAPRAQDMQSSGPEGPVEPPDGAEARQPEAGDDEGQSGGETTAAENPNPSPRLTGWCSRVPLWSAGHLDCISRRRTSIACACVCHDDGWTRPPVPEGAQLSKFNPANPNKEAQ